ncbi:MAG: prephenate dehydratase [Candidatus Altiarchaeia archaeon]
MPKKNSVAVLGPKGTFTEEAAKKLFPGRELDHCNTVEEVFEAVDNGTEYGVVAVENSLEGAVNTSMDCLLEHDVGISKEAVLDIHMCLMAPPGTKKEEIKTILSHSHSFGQCRKYLKKNYPKAALKRYDSNTAAIKELGELKPKGVAAIGPGAAAELYGLEILAGGIEDAPSQTRFIAITKKISTAGKKSSVIFALKDRPGALYHALKDYADNGINLTRIESRPAKKKLGEYSFFIDFEGSLDEDKVKNALKSLKEKTIFLKVLGSY